MTTETQAHYLRLWKSADEILRQSDNPCQITPAGEGYFMCTYLRLKGLPPNKELCCIGCRHLGPSGCTVKALGCKLGWCWTSSRAIEGQKIGDHPTFVAIAALRQEAIELGVPLWGRESFEGVFHITEEPK